MFSHPYCNFLQSIIILSWQYVNPFLLTAPLAGDIPILVEKFTPPEAGAKPEINKALENKFIFKTNISAR